MLCHFKFFVNGCEISNDCWSLKKKKKNTILPRPAISLACFRDERSITKFGSLTVFHAVWIHRQRAAGPGICQTRHRAFLRHQQGEARWRKNLRIGTSITIGFCLLPAYMQSVKRSIFPHTNRTGRSGKLRPTIEQKLLETQIHIGIIEGMVHSPVSIARPFRDAWYFICSPSHPLQGAG